jgi:hypothetical protein
VEQAFMRIARKRGLSILFVFLSALCLRLLIVPLLPIPEPVIQDDFSYLLAGDTFASGRLTNPIHPMWKHFESFHITWTPTYMSMYFPAQGLVLAAGKVMAGHPWYGVLVSAAVMCAAICWMLQGWIPPGWALLGGMLAVLRLGLFSYWMDTYTGGAAAAIGGALVLGALPRLRRAFRTRDFFWMALGMGILANSRPYEGLLISIPALMVLCRWLEKESHPRISVLIQRILPGAAVIVVTIAFMAYYNHCVFGSVFTPPYAVNRATYASAPHFIWQSPRPAPVYRHAVMREFYSGWELKQFFKLRSLHGFLYETGMKVVLAELFFLGFTLLVPLVMLPRVLRDRRLRILVVFGIVFAAGLGVETWFIPHYAAPFTAGIYAILMQCMRHFRARRRAGFSAGLFFVRAVPVMCVALAVVRLYAHPLYLPVDGYPFFSWYGGTRPFAQERAQLLKRLESFSGQQLAIVRYSRTHTIFDEWVYNASDVDKSRVVWARDMNPANNLELIRYFKNRKIWLVEADLNPPKLSPYPIDDAERSQNTASVGLAKTSLIGSVILQVQFRDVRRKEVSK